MTDPRRGANGWGWALVVCAAILTAISYAGSVNEYVAMYGDAMAWAYDCHGPETVLIFSIPPLVIAVAGVFLSFRAYRMRRDRWPVIAICLGIAVLCAIAVRAPDVAAELAKNSRPDSPCR